MAHLCYTPNMAKKAAAKKPQTKISQFFDDELLVKIRAKAAKEGMSLSGFVQRLCRRALQRKTVEG